MPRSRRRGAAARLLAAALAAAAPGPAASEGTAALIIDDLGYSTERARRVLALPPPVAVAVLPHAPHARAIADAARRSGTEVLVHLPMESDDGTATLGALRRDMRPAQLRRRVRAALASVPGAIGVNNHMGSGFTRSAAATALVMDELARYPGEWLFVDSRTTARTTAERAARRAGLAVTRRDVFLDHTREPETIDTAIGAWLARARHGGCALAIGHPHPATLRALERALARPTDVDRVDLRTYIERCGTSADGGQSWHASSSRSPTAAKSSRRSPSSTSFAAPASRSSQPAWAGPP